MRTSIVGKVLIARFVLNAAALFAIVAAVACRSGTGVPEPQTKMNMKLQSASFGDGQPIPDKYSAYGQNVSPQLSWSSPPSGTKSFVLLAEDPDAPSPTPFVHWLVYNIPATELSVDEGHMPQGTAGKNDHNSTDYFGPRPPSGTHHYHFKVFAIDEQLPLSAGADKNAVMKAISGHTVGQAELVGTYSH